MVYLDTRFRDDLLQIDFYTQESNPTYKKLAWSLKPQPDTDQVFDAVGFNLYYSIIPNNIWTKLNTTPITDNFFIHNVPRYVKVDRGYYQVEAVAASGATLRSHTFDVYIPPDRTAMKMSKEFLWWLMDKHGTLIDNIPVFQYVKRTYGCNCPKCKQPGIGVLKANCPICFGTGFEGGYHEPVLTFVTYGGNFSSSKTDLGNRVSSEVSQQAETSAEVSMFDVGDFIREAQAPYRLFNVASVSFSEYNGRPLKLFLQLQLEESGHPLWKMKLPTFTMPEHIHYMKVREIYEQIMASINKNPETSISGFPEGSSPTVTTESYGYVRYRQYLEQGDFL